MTTQIGGRGRAAIKIVLQRSARRLASLASATGGNSAIEFALAAPILIGLLVPVADLGIAFSQQLQVQQAAQAGAQYALLHGYNSSNISNAVTAATTLPSVSAAPAPSQSCGCPTGTAITLLSSPPCSGTCPNGEAVGIYVFANAQYTYNPMLPYSVLPSGTILTAQAAVRVQ